MRTTLRILMFLLLSTTPALAQTPAASATPMTTTRTEDLLSRILKTLEEQLTMKSQPVAVRWEYRCTDVVAIQSADAIAANLSSLGSQGWEYVGTFGRAPMPGSIRVCFKRPGGAFAELSPTGGELGCHPTCSSAETCYKSVCIDACNPACGDDQYCANDHHCRTRTRPRK